jgi:hypothetical protein
LSSNGSAKRSDVQTRKGVIRRVTGRRQMSMRGPDKARGGWSLMMMARNIERLHVPRAVCSRGRAATERDGLRRGNDLSRAQQHSRASGAG